MSSNLNLRNIDAATLKQLKIKSKELNMSMNNLILLILHKGLGISHQRERVKYDDLDNLAGTWSKTDAEEFSASQKDFSKIDEGLWK